MKFKVKIAKELTSKRFVFNLFMLHSILHHTQSNCVLIKLSLTCACIGGRYKK